MRQSEWEPETVGPPASLPGQEAAIAFVAFRIDEPCLDRGFYGALGFVRMGAARESTIAQERAHFYIMPGQFFGFDVPQAGFTQAWGVCHVAARVQWPQPYADCRVASFARCVADVLYRQAQVRLNGIQDAAFPNPGRTA